MRLTAATGLRLASTLVFERPTPVAVAEALHARLEVAAPRPPVEAALDQVESLLDAVDDDEARRRIGERLRSLLARVAVEEPDDETVSKIQSATRDEIFELLDQEFEGTGE
jgi:erythronolide synthase/tylactone synthase